MKKAKMLHILSKENYWLRGTMCVGCLHQAWSRLSLDVPDTQH